MATPFNSASVSRTERACGLAGDGHGDTPLRQSVRLLGLFLILGRLGAAALAPLLAAVLVYLAAEPRPSPIAKWLGLTIESPG